MDWKFDILPGPQEKLLNELWQVPSDFVLYGGTAIALQLGHRESLDFDFFSALSFDPFKLYESIKLLKDAEIFQSEANTLSCRVQNDKGIVKLSFFGGLDKLKQVSPPVLMESHRVKVASMYDLFGTKCKVILQRAEIKDYLDVHAILRYTNLKLDDGLRAALSIYGSKQYDPALSLRALGSFQDGDLHTIDDIIKKDLKKAVKLINFKKLTPFEDLHIIGYEQSKKQTSKDKGISL